ncbi:hypothetical protein CsatB_009547 [Cannabis sativa]
MAQDYDYHNDYYFLGQVINQSSAAYTLSQRRRRRPKKPGTMSTIHDNSCQGYGWLLPGWIAEERHMVSGKVYRYYYDPSGRLYYTQSEVIRTWEKNGLILLDK